MDGRRYIGRGGVRMSSWLPIGPDQSPRRRRWTGADGPNRRPRQRFRRAIDYGSCSVMTGGPRLRELTSHPAAGGKFESEVPLRDDLGGRVLLFTIPRARELTPLGRLPGRADLSRIRMGLRQITRRRFAPGTPLSWPGSYP